MDIVESKEGRVFVLAPEGRLDGTNSGVLEERLLAAIEKGEKALVIDFEELNYISSSGLRVLLIAAKRLQQSGGRIALCALSPSIREVFEMSGFLRFLEAYGNRAAALESMG